MLRDWDATTFDASSMEGGCQSLDLLELAEVTFLVTL